MSLKKKNIDLFPPRVAVVITILNEADTIDDLINALLAQTLPPDEIVIVDAGSTDKSVDKIRSIKRKRKDKRIKIHTHLSNRSLGRNYGVEQTQAEWIAFTDAGCIPDPDWLNQLLKVQRRRRVPVVAGYYYGLAKTPFEEAVVPYALVMPNRVDPKTFLPATRSILIRRDKFFEVGGFNEQLQVSEDYDFAHRLDKAGVKRTMAIKARVGWYPRQNLFSFFSMVVSMAHWDARAYRIRPKVYLVFTRYLGFGWITAQMMSESLFGFWSQLWVLSIAVYIMWSIAKNRAHTPRGWYWLPWLQITADFGVMGGTLTGIFRRWI
jgi:glycosyltransferase involved in cell wall biosynthesis